MTMKMTSKLLCVFSISACTPTIYNSNANAKNQCIMIHDQHCHVDDYTCYISNLQSVYCKTK